MIGKLLQIILVLSLSMPAPAFAVHPRDAAKNAKLGAGVGAVIGLNVFTVLTLKDWLVSSLDSSNPSGVLLDDGTNLSGLPGFVVAVGLTTSVFAALGYHSVDFELLVDEDLTKEVYRHWRAKIDRCFQGLGR